MHFNHPTVASKDLSIIHKNYLTVAQKFPQNSIRLNYFLSACESLTIKKILITILRLNLGRTVVLLELTTRL